MRQDQPGPFAEKGARNGNRQDVKRGKCVCQPRQVDGTRMGNKRPAAEGRGRGCQQKGKKRYRTSCNRIARGRFFGEIAPEPPIKTVNNVNPQHDVYPGRSAHSVPLSGCSAICRHRRAAAFKRKDASPGRDRPRPTQRVVDAVVQPGKLQPPLGQNGQTNFPGRCPGPIWDNCPF